MVFFTFPEDTRWSADREANVEITGRDLREKPAAAGRQDYLSRLAS